MVGGLRSKISISALSGLFAGKAAGVEDGSLNLGSAFKKLGNGQDEEKSPTKNIEITSKAAGRCFAFNPLKN